MIQMSPSSISYQKTAQETIHHARKGAFHMEQKSCLGILVQFPYQGYQPKQECPAPNLSALYYTS